MDFRELFATAYAQAARSDADMRAVATALENIRTLISPSQSYHRVLDALDEEIGQADLIRFVPTLIQLRSAYQQYVVESESARLRREFSRDPAAGWEAWILTYAQHFQRSSWYTALGRNIALDSVTFSPVADWPIERVQRSLWLAARERWTEAYDWICFLAEQNIREELRARLLAVAAEIQLYRFEQPTKAEELLQRAEQVGPQETIVLRDRADFLVHQLPQGGLLAEKLEDAKRRYHEIARLEPRLPDGYIGLGECAEKENDDTAAESSYLQAVQVGPGSSSSHRSLMSWYAKRVDERDDLIVPVFNRLVAVADDEPGSCVSLGSLHRQASVGLDDTRKADRARKRDKARTWLERAVALQPDNGVAEIWLGYLDCDEAEGNESEADALFAKAEVHFRHAIEVCAESMDGYWGMSYVAQRRNDLEAAIAWCDKAFKSHTECESSVLVFRAQIHIQREDWQAAQTDLEASLAREAVNPSALATLLDLADKVNTAGNTELAKELLFDWRRRSGDAREATYQNRLGNWSYGADDYLTAERHYQGAVAADPLDAVLRSNHAYAAAELRSQFARAAWLDVAVSELTEAIRLDPSDADGRVMLDKLLAERAFIGTYGEAALALEITVTPIQVSLGANLLPAILDESRTKLSDESLRKTEEWREAFRLKFGFVIPGVRYGLLDDATRPSAFSISIMESEPIFGEIGDEDPLPYMLEVLSRICENRVVDFLGHEETAEMLRTSEGPEAAEILAAPEAISGFVSMLRNLHERREPIGDLGARMRQYLGGRRAVGDPGVMEPRQVALPFAGG